MDVSDERRGLPTTFAQHGVNVALLAGDLALVLADACLMESGFDAASLDRAFAAYSRMRQEVIVGQYLDVKAGERVSVSVEAARRIAVLKSGRYSIEEPLLIGASLAGADDDWMAHLQAFGAPLGEAFQLRDDLLGSFGDRSSVGKPVDSDIREGKRHVLFAFAVAALQGEQLDFFVSRWGGRGSLTVDEVERLRQLLVSSGAKVRTEDLLADLCDEARSALAQLDMPGDSAAALADLTRLATERSV
jgi:geranylgeranyl diphosphate synthase type I